MSKTKLEHYGMGFREVPDDSDDHKMIDCPHCSGTGKVFSPVVLPVAEEKPAVAPENKPAEIPTPIVPATEAPKPPESAAAPEPSKP